MAQTLNFRDIPYMRPNLEELESSFRSLTSAFSAATDAETQLKTLREIVRLRDKTETMAHPGLHPPQSGHTGRLL